MDGLNYYCLLVSAKTTKKKKISKYLSFIKTIPIKGGAVHKVCQKRVIRLLILAHFLSRGDVLYGWPQLLLSPCFCKNNKEKKDFKIFVIHQNYPHKRGGCP